MSPRREECRGCGATFVPSRDDPDACATCQTLSRAATARLLETLMPGDDDPPDEPDSHSRGE